MRRLSILLTMTKRRPKKSTALNRIIKLHRLSVTNLARLSGLTRMSIFNLQWGQCEPSIGNALRLERSIDYMTGEDYTVHDLFPEYNVKIIKDNLQ